MVERNGIGKFSGGKWGNVKLLAMLVGLGESILATASSYKKDVTATIRRTAVAIANLPHESIPDYYLPRKDVVQNLQIVIDTWSNHLLANNCCA